MYQGPVTREKRITIRIPAALKDALEREAQRDRRSVADVVIPVLEAAFVRRRAIMRRASASLSSPWRQSWRVVDRGSNATNCENSSVAPNSVARSADAASSPSDTSPSAAMIRLMAFPRRRARSGAGCPTTLP